MTAHSYILFFSGLLVVALAVGGCANSSSLTAAERAKLSPALQAIVQGQVPQRPGVAPVATRPDGTPVYAVIVRTTDPVALRNSDLAWNTVRGRIATARFTPDEIRQAVRLPAVESIELSGTASPASN
ncbi:hypothetical protein [Salisaeta longa]|uniref:hypothetical protein n=1 Tax=Salisaeta longa TaxID=503170 RepID=UPI0003B61E8C|nr:hypothetical protein [Salisaeta longa]